MEWDDLKLKVISLLEEKKLSDEYKDRLEKEIIEIEKQGANEYWCDNVKSNQTWDVNPSGLVFPWILNMTSIDPIKNGIKHIWTYETDFPDIDLDFLPQARQTIKEYATRKYTHVCSVGLWITYNPKSAIQDVVNAYGGDRQAIIKVTTSLPEEFDELTWDDHLKFMKDENDNDPKVRQEAHQEVARYAPFYDWVKQSPENDRMRDIAYRLVGKIKAQGTHAGGIIISDRPIEDIVPLSLSKGNWTSQWTEGKRTQLSKFGLVKFDILGVKTIYYIWQCANLIKRARGITIDWTQMDPTAQIPYVGYEITAEGVKTPILLNDPLALKMCNELRTESVFQIESDIQKGIIHDGVVKEFRDLVVYNALGRPGPMDEIPNYIKRRDDLNKYWKNDEDTRIIKILDDTHGTIVYQEQLTAMWSGLAKFTVPEAETARKIISKKWQDKLPLVEEKWMKGATQKMGEALAKQWWEKMVTFGRYAFNKSHSVAYSLITYQCLYLKAHYPAEWWAAVMTECHPDKLSKYMSAARLEGTQFGIVDINALNHEFSVVDGKVVPGLQSIKGIGEAASLNFTKVKGPFADIDEVVLKIGKQKGIFERLIKLGAFDAVHPNRKGLMHWYLYKYCSGTDISALRREIDAKFAWPEDKLQAERLIRIADFRKFEPKKKIPVKVQNWKPDIGYRFNTPTCKQVMDLYEDYSIKEKLGFEKDYFSFYWSSPLQQYHTFGYSVEKAKTCGKMEVVIQEIIMKMSKAGNKFYIFKVTDGIQSTDIAVWEGVYKGTDRSILKEGVGVRICVDYTKDRNSFKIANRTEIIPLILKDKPFVEIPEKKDDEVIYDSKLIPHGEFPTW